METNLKSNRSKKYLLMDLVIIRWGLYAHSSWLIIIVLSKLVTRNS